MFKIITSLVMSFAGLIANAQVTETRNVSTFNKIEISNGVEIIFTQSGQTTLKAEATNANGLQTLFTQSDGKTLKINGNSNESVKVYVSSPELVSIRASKAAKVTIDGNIDTSKMDITLLSGATFRGIVKSKEVDLKGYSDSVFNIRVESGALYASFRDNAKVNLSGSSEKATIKTVGLALCNARNFKTNDVSVVSSDQSSVQVSVKNGIAVNVSEEATVRYFGIPEKTMLNPEAVTIGNPKSAVTQN